MWATIELCANPDVDILLQTSQAFNSYPVACTLLSIALPAETKLINYLHCAPVWSDRKQMRGGSIQSNRSASPQQHPSRSISSLFKILSLLLVRSLLSWWVKKTDLTYIHVHKHTQMTTVNMKLYLCLQSVPDRMSCPPWPKGKKLVHLDLKGAPPRVEYLHKVRLSSLLCDRLQHNSVPVWIWFFIFAVHWCVFPCPPANRSVLQTGSRWPACGVWGHVSIWGGAEAAAGHDTACLQVQFGT